MKGIVVRTINEAFEEFMQRIDYDLWKQPASNALEFRDLLVIQYDEPMNRVLFNSVMDLNPFATLMDSLYMLAGQTNFSHLEFYRSKYATAPLRPRTYFGVRMRHTESRFGNDFDQLRAAIQLLRGNSQSATLAIYDINSDAETKAPYTPTENFILFKKDGPHLHMTVSARVQNILFHVFGSTHVALTMLHELVARSSGFVVGSYYLCIERTVQKVSPHWTKLLASTPERTDQYEMGKVSAFPIIEMSQPAEVWLDDLDEYIRTDKFPRNGTNFFKDVVVPMRAAWTTYTHGVNNPGAVPLNRRIDQAISTLKQHCAAADWAHAGVEWLSRRREG